MSGWGPVPGRSAVKAAAITEPAKRTPAKKDTRSWCRGKEGREHEPQIVLSHDGFRQRACEWAGRHDYRLLRRGEDDYAIGWCCGHQELCGRCGKILRDPGQIPRAECPVYPGSDEQKAEAGREAAEYPEKWRAWAARHGRPEPVIDGPQGYRRKRENA